MNGDWADFLARATDAARLWLGIEWQRGSTAVPEAYLQALRGGGDPRTGLMLSLQAAP